MSGITFCIKGDREKLTLGQGEHRARLAVGGVGRAPSAGENKSNKRSEDDYGHFMAGNEIRADT